MTAIVGIDPGITGAVAVLRDGCPPRVWDSPCITVAKGRRRPDEAAMRDILLDILASLREDEAVIAVVEDVHAHPADGRSSAFAFGEAKGLWRGMLSALGIPYVLVNPATWKRRMVGAKKGKSESLLVASRLFPTCPLNLAKHHNRAEALLIAAYGAEHTAKHAVAPSGHSPLAVREGRAPAV